MQGAGLSEASANAQALADAGLEAALARLDSGNTVALESPARSLGNGTCEFRIRPGDGGFFHIRATGTVPLPRGRAVRCEIETTAKVSGSKAVLAVYRIFP